ncbi:cyclase family protein [Sporichthya sp.]|uniref:cyclase family protein n=1 Tax=Sporichthya sp. TaxID=65475 RepID=UPI0017ADA560|nr:cyclase family protein [Sporichthya sp.]MBA3741976.1 cyclase family protein [Sporichthya sp.]
MSNWGRWGAEDQLGALNLITPEKRVEAASLVRTGAVYQLGQNIQADGVPMVKDGARGFWMRPLHMMVYDGGDEAAGVPTRGDNYFSAEDFIAVRIHGTTTHLDGLSHGWKHGQLYNGFGSNQVNSSGAHKLGIENVGQVMTRGLLFDIAGLKAVSSLDEGYPITIEDMQQCNLEIRPGDVVVVRTGWYNVYFESQDRYNGAWPGISTETAQWLADQDVCIVGADTVGVEVLGGSFGKEGFACPVHGLLLRDYGIYLLELMHLEELAAAGVTEFCFVMAPLRITGATASPVNPLALV